MASIARRTRCLVQRCAGRLWMPGGAISRLQLLGSTLRGTLALGLQSGSSGTIQHHDRTARWLRGPRTRHEHHNDQASFTLRSFLFSARPWSSSLSSATPVIPNFPRSFGLAGRCNASSSDEMMRWPLSCPDAPHDFSQHTHIPHITTVVSMAM